MQYIMYNKCWKSNFYYFKFYAFIVRMFCHHTGSSVYHFFYIYTENKKCTMKLYKMICSVNIKEIISLKKHNKKMRKAQQAFKELSISSSGTKIAGLALWQYEQQLTLHLNFVVGF